MKEKQSWDGRSKTSSLGMWIFIKIISFLGLLPAYILLAFVTIYYTVFSRALKKYIEAFRSKLWLTTDNWNVYKHIFTFGMNLVDKFAHLAVKKSPFTFVCIGEEHLVNALKKKKGLILLSSHIGNQEIAGNVLFDHIKTPVNFLMLDNEKKSIKKVTKKFTRNRKINIISTDIDELDKMIKVKTALNNNEIVCMLADRIMGNEQVKKLSFLGKEANFPTSPFNIAAITGSPVIAVVTVKTGLKQYTQKAYDFISFDNVTRTNRDQLIQKAMKKYVSILEEIVNEHPYQWFNFYDFWEEFN